MDELKIEPKGAEQPLRAGARRALAGLLVRKERWGLSLRGKLLLCAGFVILSAAVVLGMYPFLAVSERVSGSVLVIEGWIPTYALPEAAREFKPELHQRVIVARAIYKSASKYESGAVMADYIAENLITEGIPRERVHTVMIEAGRRDRTYSAAEAVKQWLRESGVSVTSLDIVTLGPHARRSRLLYQKAFGTAVRVGVIALEDASYDPRRWWRYSAGLREVPAEAAAYVYSKFFFSPK
jgi:hypothetical protein